jgi:phosphoglycolate phosphatase
MNIKLIIFDLDGTLVDSLDDLADATNHMLGQFGMAALTRDDVRLLVGQGARRLVERAMPEANPNQVDEGVKLFLAYNEIHIADKTITYPGVAETIPRLAENYLLAVISNKYESHCKKLLSLMGISQYFSRVMGVDSHPSRKPSPEPLLKLMEELGVTAAQTAMVGDSSNDILAGKGAEVVTIGCSYGYGDISEIQDADYRIDRFPELLDLPLFSHKD